MIQTNPDFSLQIRTLVRSVRDLASSRAGRLVRLTVSVPPGTPAEEWIAHARTALAKGGITPELEISAAPGLVRILSAEFER